MTVDEFGSVAELARAIASTTYQDTKDTFLEHAPSEERTPWEMAEGFYQAGVITGVARIIRLLEEQGVRVEVNCINPKNN